MPDQRGLVGQPSSSARSCKVANAEQYQSNQRGANYKSRNSEDYKEQSSVVLHRDKE